jgi:signal peptidase I
MTDLNLSPEASPSRPTIGLQSPSKSRWKGPLFSVLLSLLFPGLGQLRNREMGKGVLAAAIFPLLTMIVGYSRNLLSFRGMFGFLVLRLFLLALICLDAFRGARQGGESRKSFREARFLYVAVGVLILGCAVFPATDYFLHKFGYFHAFKVASASMCPTICEGERVVADMDAFIEHAPQRGDVILLDFQSMHGPLYIKRVVGLAGDVVSERNGTILVNGKPFATYILPQDCTNSKDVSLAQGEEPRFNPVSVPASSFFVVGDNSSNSYDSRIPGFGLATPDQVKGRPLYIYWSTDKSRIGCVIR